ncbi:hypothetical protein LOS78_05545 [Paracoccus sp. MA]|uniref:hypothetical protein n=1 Tax=Paracoccus sp. MA TaxID=2895796 RepID=UPI001E4E85A3|nr:hypothetical protein [Paracoccus sp. MA]UFM63628.1 hypothetical protein LOS78_05545 [Paracoccus sp. MA]
MSDLRLSERIRVGLALGGQITISREAALVLIKLLEDLEQSPRRIDLIMADWRESRRRMEERNELIIRDLFIVCFCLTCLGWILAGAIH